MGGKPWGLTALTRGGCVQVALMSVKDVREELHRDAAELIKHADAAIESDWPLPEVLADMVSAARAAEPELRARVVGPGKAADEDDRPRYPKHYLSADAMKLLWSKAGMDSLLVMLCGELSEVRDSWCAGMGLGGGGKCT